MAGTDYQVETPTDGVWKFVRVNGQYHWLAGMDNHSDVVDKGEKAEAAGTVFVFKDQKLARMESRWSTSLGIGTDAKTHRYLSYLFSELGYRWRTVNETTKSEAHAKSRSSPSQSGHRDDP